MIPFASQRALGQDLATHLLNEYDNDYMEVADVRGAVADDLHGAFAEWEAQAHALTKCENYLYSLSINPDQRQGRLTRDQYMDYIDRVEEKLGLTDQGRAVVFHIKDGREHAHVVWSRIDLENEKAVQMSFDRDKLMMVTRLFAKEHGLELPKGYERHERKMNGKPKEAFIKGGNQYNLFEMYQQRITGISAKVHKELVTEAWQHCDSAKAFVHALAEKGYILSRGNRPYVLVDLYGTPHSLPRMIDDKTVRLEHVEAFLKEEYPSNKLPHVDASVEDVAKHRKAIEEHIKAEQRADKLADLKKMQQARRRNMEAAQEAVRQKQKAERQELTLQHEGERKSLRAAYVVQAKQIKQKRTQNRPTGLAAFLGRVSGVALVAKKIQQHRDRKRLEAYKEKMGDLKERQERERKDLEHRQTLKMLDLERKVRALDQVEKREQRSLDESLQKEVRIQARGGREQMPSLGMELIPRGRSDASYKAKNRYISDMAKERYTKPKSCVRDERKEVDLSGDFARAANDGEKGGEGQGDSDPLKPKSQARLRRARRSRSRKPDQDHGR
jgi:hypothetical protein